jgi:hypothetical protein
MSVVVRSGKETEPTPGSGPPQVALFLNMSDPRTEVRRH